MSKCFSYKRSFIAHLWFGIERKQCHHFESAKKKTKYYEIFLLEKKKVH